MIAFQSLEVRSDHRRQGTSVTGLEKIKLEMTRKPSVNNWLLQYKKSFASSQGRKGINRPSQL